jgi:hypothetical protein
MGTVTTSIERPLTEPELADLGKQQARLLQDIGELVMQKKVAIDEFKAAIGEKQKQVEELSARINLGLDRQEVECDVLFDTPEKGRKSFVAIQTGRIVKIEEMAPADYQSRLFDADERSDSGSASSDGQPQ